MIRGTGMTQANAELLIEIGTEEIPAWMISPAAGQFARDLADLLRTERLSCRVGAVWYTPRRLIALISDLPMRQEDLVETVVGPPKRVAYDAEGAPTQAALAFAQKNRVPMTDIRITRTPKGEYLSLERRTRGEPTMNILARVAPTAIGRMQFAKTMYWTADKFRFARPIRWVLALYADRGIRFRIADVRASVYSSGHRFLGKSKLPIRSTKSFKDLLRANGVIVDPAERRAVVTEGLMREAVAIGGQVREDPELLETVVNLNENPSVICGSFEERFLVLPQEILITVMREHQKYFAMLDAGGRLMPYFLAVINLESDRDGTIRAGHERVLRARLADAEFFWSVDRKIPLGQREARLKQVLYQEKLGSYWDKTQRVLSLLPRLAQAAGQSVPLADLQEAAHLMKCDLVTEMVKELTDLQGIVGGLYARAEGYSESVWRAVYEQYLPRSTASPSPSSRAGALLSLADRLDTVCGCFSIGLMPSSSGDPFALRRQGNAILKIILDHRLSLSLAQLISWGLEAVERPDPGTAEEIRLFFEGRLRFLLGERGFAYDCLNAALAAGCDDPLDACERVQALEAMRGEADFLALAAGFKRIANILAKTDTAMQEPDPARMTEPGEIALWQRYSALRPAVEAARRSRDYDRALRSLASMRSDVDLFFDKVLVMADDPVVRANRLALLRELADLFLGIADISQIVIDQTK